MKYLKEQDWCEFKFNEKFQTRQKGRLDQQREIARKIVQGIQEVDFAKEFYQQKLDTVENERQNILDNKLKPKGRLLAKKD